MDNLIGRSGLARLLEVSEKTARMVEMRGEIAPETFIEGRPMFSAAKARVLRDRREADRVARLRLRQEKRTAAATSSAPEPVRTGATAEAA
jgi:hypothetical protein